MQTKRCPKCGLVKAVEEFSKSKSTRDGLCYKCKKCYAEYHKNNKEKMAKAYAKYHKKNKDKRLEYLAEYRKKNKDKIHKIEKKQRETLSRGYVNRLLKRCGFKNEQITTELIEAKRQQIQRHRLIKEGKKNTFAAG